jgi:hypothetical protein
MRRSTPFMLYAGVTANLFSWCPLLAGHPSFGPVVPLAQEGWKAEYESMCAKTDVAMTLSVGELNAAIAQCVELKARIEAQEETTRKVYLR